jgi:RNA polymerase sigma factor (sigma-70 family)
VPFLSQFGPVGLEGDEQEFIPDGRGGDRPYGEDELKVLRAALSRIPEMERVVLVRRFFDRETLLEIGTALGVSKEAIRQTQQKALARLRQMMMDDES